MKTVFFIVKLPNGNHKFSITRHHKNTFVERMDADTKNTKIITKSIYPNQLMYAVKEFNLLHRFRRQVYRFLKNLGQTVHFHVVEPKNGGLIDHAW